MRPFILTLCLLVAAIARGQTGRDIVSQMLPADALLPNAQALGLSPDQQAQLREKLLPLLHEVAPLQEHLRDLTAGFVSLLGTEKPAEAAVLAKFAEVEQLESQIKVLRLKMTLAAKAVLSADQQERAMSLRVAAPAVASNGGDSIRSKLQRVRDGIERMKREGRDVTEVAALWAEFQKRAELRHHQLALKALNDALAIVEPQGAKP